MTGGVVAPGFLYHYGPGRVWGRLATPVLLVRWSNVVAPWPMAQQKWAAMPLVCIHQYIWTTKLASSCPARQCVPVAPPVVARQAWYYHARRHGMANLGTDAVVAHEFIGFSRQHP